MISTSFHYESLAYKRPVPVRGKTLNENLFLKVTLLGEDYFLSVLPNFHQATLQEMAYKIKIFFEEYPLSFKEIDFTKKFFNLTPIDDFLASIHHETLFNIECILLNLLSKTHPHLTAYNKPVKINKLYRPTEDISAYRESLCLKIKIAPKEHKEHKEAKVTLDLINQLHTLNPSMQFRLDGNRQFELSELISFHDILVRELPNKAFLQIDYIEEPFKNFYDTYLFQKRSKINIAIDESLPSLLDSNKLFSPVVIKPSLIGVSPVISLLRSRQDLRAIISSSFEHPTIMNGLYFIAHERPSEFHGLENFIK